MSFFEEDPFEDIVREFFGSPRSGTSDRAGKVISGEEEERNIDYIENSEKVFFVFELPGYSEEDIGLQVKSGKVHITASKKDLSGMAPYFSNKLSRDLKIVKVIPNHVKDKKYDFTFRNGILEVCFRK